MELRHQPMARAALVALSLVLAGPAGAETIKVGLGTGGVAHLYVAQEKGYFAADARLDVKDVMHQIAW